MLSSLKSILSYDKPYRVYLYQKAKNIYHKLLKKNLPHKGHKYYLKYQITKAINLASNLGHKRMSILEFGVAGGQGLLEIEAYCKDITKNLDLDIEIYGFDLEKGLPPSKDYRDEPYKWVEGSYSMDMELLLSKIKKSKLIIGDVKKTVPEFVEKYNPAPIGFINFDLDLYWPTKCALEIFNEEDLYFLPRVECFFDDIFFEHAGIYLAINEFNAENEMKKIGQNNRTLVHNFNEIMKYRMFEYHKFNHVDYSKNNFMKNKAAELPIK
ncbi:MAG: hypothetical protein GY714_15690 [Desulfobacterales bacterium]|nr:hypothetical protein [Desulfobacterales bacterium]